MWFELTLSSSRFLLSVLSLLFIQCTLGELAYQTDNLQIPLPGESKPTKRVAIIGAGAAGSSTAYFLRQYADESDLRVNITVFERNTIGGRSTTVYAFENDAEPTDHLPRVPVELGASIFVSVNHILVDAVRMFNLSLASDAHVDVDRESQSQVLGVWDGRKFVITQQLSGGKLETWWSTIKLLWRYGFSPFRTLKLMRSVVNDFLKLYDEPIFPWKDLTDAAGTLGLLDVTNMAKSNSTSTGRDFLARNGVDDKFALEVVQASTRVNYAQNLGLIHGLETMVCMATDGAMAVDGGNWQIMANMINASKANVFLDTEVIEVNRLEHATALRLKINATAALETQIYEFDTVVLAAPYHQAKIHFDPSPSHVPDDIEYVKLHVTLFSSQHKLSPLAFNLPVDTSVPDIVLTTLPADEQDKLERSQQGVGFAGFFSISKVQRATNYHVGPPRQEYIYKIFSPDKVNDTSLYKLLGAEMPSNDAGGPEGQFPITDDISWVYRHVWESYPYLPPRVTFEPLQLGEDLWYTSGMDSFISTMETSSLSGKNVARLIVDGWMDTKCL